MFHHTPKPDQSLQGKFHTNLEVVLETLSRKYTLQENPFYDSQKKLCTYDSSITHTTLCTNKTYTKVDAEELKREIEAHFSTQGEFQYDGAVIIHPVGLNKADEHYVIINLEKIKASPKAGPSENSQSPDR